ncbi:MAG: baseplate J/gp47 family protein [Clostridia bacterium]|nr:baseplate J/gp47 family protein [Clostridia bacterium]
MSLTQEEYEGLLARSLDHFSDRTYENLMAEFLERMPDIYDKRDGSMAYNAGAARNFEGAQQYGALDFILSQTFALSASREHLIKRASDRSIYPYPATPSVHYALFDRAGQDVPAGTRFSCEDLNFVVIEFDDDEGKSLKRTVTIDGEQKLVQLVECETPGAAGNGYSGDLIPIDLIAGLQKAYMYPEVHKDGTDEEETEHFRARYIEKMRSIAFAGNVADYRERILALDGVGQCKVYPEWNNDGVTPALLNDADAIAAAKTAVNAMSSGDAKTYLLAMVGAAEAGKLTVGGAVKVVVAGADLTDPVVPPERIAELQEKIDPRSSAAEGDGIAPIGHLVTVASVEQVAVNITVAVTFHNNNTTAEDVQTAVEDVISKYFVDLCKKWSASGKNGVDILHSTISYLILADELLASWIRTVESVTISGTDGANKNRTLGVDEVPVLGEVTIV